MGIKKNMYKQVKPSFKDINNNKFKENIQNKGIFKDKNINKQSEEKSKVKDIIKNKIYSELIDYSKHALLSKTSKFSKMRHVNNSLDNVLTGIVRERKHNNKEQTKRMIFNGLNKIKDRTKLFKKKDIDNNDNKRKIDKITKPIKKVGELVTKDFINNK